MWTGIDWWNDASTGVDARQALCARIGWPSDYAEGEADHEWLTDEQFAILQDVPLEWLDEAEAVVRWRSA